MPLSNEHRAILIAATARLIPADEHGPGATEANVVRYIERALATDYEGDASAYAEGLARIDASSHSLYGERFADLTSAQQDAVLALIEDGAEPSDRAFFDLVLQHTKEGMFGDPSWGGNVEFVGWKLIDYADRDTYGQPMTSNSTSSSPQPTGTAPPLLPPRANPKRRTLGEHKGARGRRRPHWSRRCGGIAAHVLTQAGLEVVALEAGPRLEASMMTLDEVRNDYRKWLSSLKVAGEIPTWRNNPNEIAGPTPWPILMMNAVGGTTVHYDCASFRFQPWHFASRTRTIERYGPGAIPPDSTLADWPLSYEELEPYYEAVEYAIGISGRSGNLQGELNPQGNVFEAPRRRDYPMPPVHASGWNELMSEGARSLGWHPFQVPSAINSQPYNGNPECTFCGFCFGNGCYRNAKSSMNVTLIPIAEATNRLRVESSARVVGIEVDTEGLVSGVRYVKDGREIVQPARAVLLGCFVYENTRLLLLSRSKAYPEGLSNNHGQVGRHYCAHLTPFAFGLFPGRRLNRFNGSGAQTLGLDDWNADNFDHEGLGFLGGANLALKQEIRPIQVATDPPPPGIPRWGSTWKEWITTHAHSLGSAFAQMENLTYEDNVLDLDPLAKDPYGVSVVRVTHRLGEQERQGWDFMRAKLETWLSAAGASETWSPEAMHVEARHPYGGTRMGSDPETSVVDAFGFSHEVPNLGVIGASTFPTTGGHNPTLTLQALTWRTAEHLVESWKTRLTRP